MKSSRKTEAGVKRVCYTEGDDTPKGDGEGRPSAVGKREATQASKIKRAPVRKYFNSTGELIRKEDVPAAKDRASEPAGSVAPGISIASLKEKFGLSQKQVEGIIKEAEKEGRARKDLDGSYVLA